MDTLAQEVQQWNSPLIGAYLLWRFTIGYCNARSNGEAPVALLHFLATPLLTNKRLLEPINRRRKNLQSYIRSFENSKDSDILISIHNNVKNKLSYTLAAIDIAISTGLLAWDIEDGKLYPRKEIERSQRGSSLKAIYIRDGEKAEIMGNWFAEHPISLIASYLKVVL